MLFSHTVSQYNLLLYFNQLRDPVKLRISQGYLNECCRQVYECFVQYIQRTMYHCMCLYVHMYPAIYGHVCTTLCACLSRSSLTVAVSVWLATLRPVQVSALTQTTVTGCSRPSWLSLSSLPLSSPLEGHQAT